MTFYDAHFHAVQCKNVAVTGASCALSQEEFFLQEKLMQKYQDTNIKIFSLFGIHPANPLIQNAYFMENLLKQNKICAIGEIGFDFFTKELKAEQKKQELVWNTSLELALEYKVPVVVHNRKALDYLFLDEKKLKMLPSVVLHSFCFGFTEAVALIKHLDNVYFSFGKPLLNGSKKNAECIKNLPLERILLETDAPFQTLKGELQTCTEDIYKVYNKASELKNIMLEELCFALEKNFFNVFAKI